MSPVFTIKNLLAGVACTCVGFAILTQVGFENAEFQISENELVLNENDLVSGELWGYMGAEVPSANQWSFVCEVRNVDRPSLLNLKVGKKNRIRYRAAPFGPFKQQDGFRIYLTQTLGFSTDHIVGFVRTSEGTKVVIDGTHKQMQSNLDIAKEL